MMTTTSCPSRYSYYDQLVCMRLLPLRRIGAYSRPLARSLLHSSAPVPVDELRERFMAGGSRETPSPSAQASVLLAASHSFTKLFWVDSVSGRMQVRLPGAAGEADF